MGFVVVLVPWRGGDELREQNWDITRPHLEALGYPLFLGDSDGKWSRGPAVNAAAREAGAWDIAIIADADTIPEPDAIRRGIRLATRTGGGVRPHDRLWRLTPSGTIAFTRGKELEERHVYGTQPGGGLCVVAREGWDRVGGYDERFIGWGHEDTVFGTALAIKADWDRIPGEAWHLFHPDEHHRTPEYQRNRQMMRVTLRDHREALRALSRRKGYDLSKIL